MSGRTSVLSIHSVDTLGEEGVLADSVVFRELQCAPLMVSTTVLAVSPGRIDALEPVSLGVLAQQFESAMGAGSPDAVRIGILADRRQVELVGELLAGYRIPNVVVAPVFRVARSVVLGEPVLDAMRNRLFRRARVVVVRAGDLDLVAGRRPAGLDELRSAAALLRRQGAKTVLISGGLMKGRVLDLLDDGGDVTVFDSTRLEVSKVDGLAGAHAAALAGHLARGLDLRSAAAAAQRYVGLRLRRGK